MKESLICISASLYEKLTKERELAASTLKEQKEAKAHSSQGSTEGSQRSSEKSSPLRFFQKNFVDKIKDFDVGSVLQNSPTKSAASVSSLSTSIDKFVHSDDEEIEIHENDEIDNSSDLPPVVKLADGQLNLLTLEIFSGIPPNADTVKKFEDSIQPGIPAAQAKTPTQDRLNPFMKSDINDLETDSITHNIEENTPVFLAEKPAKVSSDFTGDDIVFSHRGKKHKDKKIKKDKKKQGTLLSHLKFVMGNLKKNFD